MGYPSIPKWPFQGFPLETKKLTSTDNAQLLATAYVGSTASQITGADEAGQTQVAKGCFLTVETNSIRYAFRSTPTQAGLGHLVPAGTTIWLGSKWMIDHLRFISASAGSHASVQVTPEV